MLEYIIYKNRAISETGVGGLITRKTMKAHTKHTENQLAEKRGDWPYLNN